MEKTTLRKLNDALNHAEARLNRARLAAELAEIEVRQLKNAIEEGVTKFQSDITSPLYDVYVAGTNSKRGKIKAKKAKKQTIRFKRHSSGPCGNAGCSKCHPSTVS